MPTPTSRKDAPSAPSDVDLTFLETSSIVAALVVAPDGVIVGANARMRRFLGVGEGSPANERRLGDYLVDSTAWDAWREVPASGRQIELELRGFDGARRSWRGDLFPRTR